MRESGLLKNINSFSLVLVAPQYTQLVDYNFYIAGENVTWRLFIADYIVRNYPFVNIVEFQDSETSSEYEAPTLTHLYNKALQKDGQYLYIHSKGISHKNPNPAIDNWRDILNHHLISRWRECVDRLSDHDVVAVRDRHVANVGEILVSGNFFWANSSYIKTLEPPALTDRYCSNPQHYPGMPLYRLGLEKWILSGKPNHYWIADTGLDHYVDYCRA